MENSTVSLGIGLDWDREAFAEMTKAAAEATDALNAFADAMDCVGKAFGRVTVVNGTPASYAVTDELRKAIERKGLLI